MSSFTSSSELNDKTNTIVASNTNINVVIVEKSGSLKSLWQKILL